MRRTPTLVFLLVLAVTIPGPARADAPAELFAVHVAERYGYINGQGQMIIAPQFILAFPFSERPAVVETAGGKYSYVDANGRWAIAARLEWGGKFSNGLAPVAIGTGHGYVDSTGRLVTPPQFDDTEELREGMEACSHEKLDHEGLFPNQRSPVRVQFSRSSATFLGALEDGQKASRYCRIRRYPPANKIGK